VARPLDVAQTEAQAANTRGSLVRAESDVNNGRTALAFLIGVPDVVGTLSDEFTPPVKLESAEVYQKAADESRRDLQAAHAAVTAARANVDVAVGQYYPSISLNLNAFMYDENFSNASKWNGLISANLPVFSAGLIEADVRTAFSQLRQALLNESLLRRQVCQDVRTAMENVEAGRKLIRNLEVQVAAASQAFHLAEQNYTVGFATNLERLAALDQFLSAQLQMASETYFQKYYYLQLLRVIGRLRADVLDIPTTMPAATDIPGASAVTGSPGTTAVSSTPSASTTTSSPASRP
jgi:outer membrane protein TolC